MALISEVDTYPPLPESLRVLQLNEQIEIQKETILFNDRWSPHDANLLSDGSIALSRFYTPTNSYDIQLAKTSSIDIISTINEDKADTTFDVFPNPSSSDQNVNLIIENNFFGNVKIEILSVDGQILRSFDEEKSEFRMETYIDLQSIGPRKVVIVRYTDIFHTKAKLLLKD